MKMWAISVSILILTVLCLHRCAASESGGGVVLAKAAGTWTKSYHQDPDPSFPVEFTQQICDRKASHLIPCHDTGLLTQLRLKSNWTFMEEYERHCPPAARRHKCLTPPPPGYEIPIKWQASRRVVWETNVPSTHLLQEKSGWNQIFSYRNHITIPCGIYIDTSVEAYIFVVAKMLGFRSMKLNEGGRIRTALDVASGVGCLGAHLFDHNIITMSLAPIDAQENHVQFALERGVPAMVGVLATKRLPYPSRSFDLALCSRCTKDWLQRDGILLLELDRVLSPGGYFVYSPPEDDTEIHKMRNSMHDLLKRMCWSIAASSDQITVWSKPWSNDCYFERELGTEPLLCSLADDPDEVWNVSMKACITPYSPKMHIVKGSGLHGWPPRLIRPPPRLEEVGSSAYEFRADTVIWKARVDEYLDRMKPAAERNKFRNTMDMNSNLGGFGAAMRDWVMNVAPVHASSRLKIVYDRGLIGSVHDWCESFSTYPRSYDLLHAWMVFSEIEQRGCSKEDLLIEMDRMLRPDGFVIIRDNPAVIRYVRKYLSSLFWNDWLIEFIPAVDALSSANETVLIVRKKLWAVRVWALM